MIYSLFFIVLKREKGCGIRIDSKLIKLSASLKMSDAAFLGSRTKFVFHPATVLFAPMQL
jgi:hypothetical protein